MSRFVKKLKNTLLITLLLVFIILFVDLVQNLSKNGNSIVLDRKPQRIHSKFTHLVKNVVQTFDTKNTVTKDTLELPESVTKDGLLKDWHDYKFIEMEKSRTGLGEQGKAAYLYDHDETRENDALYEKTGFSVLVSNKISVNRSLPDQRHEKCKEILYLRNLSSVSVIVIFYNEILSVLKRTLHSVWNRTPVELLHEIILVNDNSSYSDLYEPLENYVNTNFPNKVTIINLKERKGLMVARMEGARKASGKILLFLDSHIEVNTNYLPPLIEPIVRNKKIGTVPIHEYIEPDSFEVILDKDSSGSRGVVDWKFDFHEFGKRDEDRTIPYKPFPTPIMLGKLLKKS
jgi:polypeptide N-acetylgalactosaminyltransferase